MTALVQTREGLIVFSDDIDYEEFSLGKFILFSSFDKMTFRKRDLYTFSRFQKGLQPMKEQFAMEWKHYAFS